MAAPVDVCTQLRVPTDFSPKELMATAAAPCCQVLATKWDYIIQGNKRKRRAADAYMKMARYSTLPVLKALRSLATSK